MVIFSFLEFSKPILFIVAPAMMVFGLWLMLTKRQVNSGNDHQLANWEKKSFGLFFIVVSVVLFVIYWK